MVFREQKVSVAYVLMYFKKNDVVLLKKKTNSSLLIYDINLLCYEQEMLRPIPVALVSCTRYFEAITAMRESFVTLQKMRVGSSQSSSKYVSRRTSPTESECVTPRSSANDLDLKSP